MQWLLCILFCRVSKCVNPIWSYVTICPCSEVLPGLYKKETCHIDFLWYMSGCRHWTMSCLYQVFSLTVSRSIYMTLSNGHRSSTSFLSGWSHRNVLVQQCNDWTSTRYENRAKQTFVCATCSLASLNQQWKGRHPDIICTLPVLVVVLRLQSLGF